MIGSTWVAAPAPAVMVTVGVPAVQGALRARSARARGPAERSRLPLPPTRMRTTMRITRTTRTRHTPRTPRTRRMRHDCAPKRRISPRTAAPAPTVAAAGLQTRRASAGVAAGWGRGVRARSTSVQTASCLRTTRVTSPLSSTNTSPERSPSTNLKNQCQWCPETCRHRSSTQRPRQACPPRRVPAWTSTTTTLGTSTTRGTGTRRTGTRRSTTRLRRRTTTWRRRRATAGCCWAAARCPSTSPWSGRSPRTSTPPPAHPTPTPPCPVWRRRCRTRRRTSTGSEESAEEGGSMFSGGRTPAACSQRRRSGVSAPAANAQRLETASERRRTLSGVRAPLLLREAQTVVPASV